MIIFYKGKGILVPVLLVASWIVVIAVGVLIENYAGIVIIGPSSIILMSLSLILCGLLTRFVAKDYIKKDGKRVEIDLDNRFFFIKMENVGVLFTILGIMVLGYGVYATFISKYFA